MNKKQPISKKEWILRTLRDMVTKNKLLKVLSLLFALIIWSVMITTESPMRTRTIHDVPVAVNGYTSLRNRGFAIPGGYESLEYTAQVLIEVPQSDLASSQDKVTARIDLADVVTSGGQWVDVIGSVPGGNAICTPRRVWIEVEPLTHRSVPVDVRTDGVLSEGYRIEAIDGSPDSITVSGPKSLVDQVTSAQVTVDLSHTTSSINRSFDYVLLDGSGAAMDTSELEFPDGTAIMVSAEVLPLVSIPVDKEGCLTGDVADGYYLKSVQAQPDSIQVSAPQAVLDEIGRLALSPIDIDGKSESFTVVADVQKPNDIRWIQHDQVSILVTIAEVEETKTFTGMRVEVLNQHSGTSIDFDSDTEVRVEITGPRSSVRDLTREDIQVFIDLSAYEIGEGEHDIPIQVRAKNETVTSTITPSTIRVRIAPI